MPFTELEALDSDKDGVISFGEFSEARARWLGSVYHMIDVDGDGELRKAEWDRMLKACMRLSPEGQVFVINDFNAGPCINRWAGKLQKDQIHVLQNAYFRLRSERCHSCHHD